jgi:hypothetical protein
MENALLFAAVFPFIALHPRQVDLDRLLPPLPLSPTSPTVAWYWICIPNGI